jgi:23S rRNA (cytosine1962-C5)-methyltransferase
MKALPRVVLKKGRERSVLKRHPWIYSGAIERNEGEAEPGCTVDVVDSNGTWLARGAYSPSSAIRVRIWTWEPAEMIDQTFVLQRLHRAITLRQRLGLEKETNAMRLVHGESDGLPGLIVDRYGQYLVLQILSVGVEFWRNEIVTCLLSLLEGVQIFERSDVDVRILEGLEPRIGVIHGMHPEPFIIQENGLSFHIDIAGGQKTGFYLDQRWNRQSLREMVLPDSEVLNCFSYTGAFGVYVLAGGSGRITSIDSSEEALATAKMNFSLNGFNADEHEWLGADVFQALRTFRDSRRSFDCIILDPPKFAHTKSQAQKAARGYKDINLLAMKLLRPGGLLFTFSCSGGISAEFFRQIVEGAALDAGGEYQIVRQLHQDRDHPILLNFPESEYLKGLVCVKSG